MADVGGRIGASATRTATRKFVRSEAHLLEECWRNTRSTVQYSTVHIIAYAQYSTRMYVVAII
jgi:hypothetical protein